MCEYDAHYFIARITLHLGGTSVSFYTKRAKVISIEYLTPNLIFIAHYSEDVNPAIIGMWPPNNGKFATNCQINSAYLLQVLDIHGIYLRSISWLRWLSRKMPLLEEVYHLENMM